MAPSASTEKQNRLQISLNLPVVKREAPVQRNIRIRKFDRLSKTPPDQLWPAGLTADLIKSHQRKRNAIATMRLAMEAAQKPVTLSVAAVSQVQNGVAAEARAQVQGSLVTALVDPGQTRDETLSKPFSLVLSEAAHPLPDTIPLPEARPKLIARGMEKPSKPETPVRELAYASPAQVDTDDEVREKVRPNWFGSRSRSRGRTAYYDIAAGVVHLPSGERLEAHSGIGPMRDNPKYVHMKMRGSTPPGTFKLSMREKLFHGVQALRMTPVDGVHPHGRTGLLTHSYLLGRNGNSHGCVAFKNYPRFLAAYKRGEIDTLVVVPNMNAGKTQFASLFGKKG
ncbi:DUF2778 domain-containing protein [Rhizobium sp. ARZ01]|uniref:DUF2778 domain-containing protein n=1 Tax=Rhizobium sp. ARZ01 TaxID=2769313 RepID=UPI001FF04276|nr:DUF2778 domain-containing protein [Rhizobium sp. ARZ01]